MRPPKLSVILPSYNHGHFLRERIDSILNQSFQDFELIFLDDCSTDNSVAILREYEAHPRVSALVTNARNSGSPFPQWQRGLDLAVGELIWIAESDDSAEFNFLAKMVELFESHENLTLAYCRSQRVDEWGASLGDDFWPDALDGVRWRRPFVADASKEVEDYLSWRNTIPNASAVVFRRAAAEQVAVPCDMLFAGDWVFWIHLLQLGGRIGYTPDVLNRFRKHSGTTRQVKSAEAERRRLLEYLRAIEVAGQPFRLSGLSVDTAHGWMLTEFLSRGHPQPFWLLSVEGLAFRSRLCFVVAAVMSPAIRTLFGKGDG
ncbi:MAG: glycosyltransferase [Gemmatimonadetes bacterium]|nr:glycosyltransferase [Gemmatimonadota bacterium]